MTTLLEEHVRSTEYGKWNSSKAVRKEQVVGLIYGASVYFSILITVNFHRPVAVYSFT
jgi:hypothetical protein